ncbi:MAG: peptidoglycan DD-metalloendopeptidase family protein [Gemmatimonadaceae bacterium]
MRMSGLVLLMPIAACEAVSNRTPRVDTATTASSGAIAQTPGAPDSAVPATRGRDTAGRDTAGRDSAGRDTTVPSPDTATLLLYPAQPQRGGVIFALARGVSAERPRCTWRGAPLPCYRVAEGVRAFIPLPATEPAGTYALTIDRPGGRIARQITVTDRTFGEQNVFVAESLYRRATRRSDIARDARALLRVLAGESAEQRWTGPWEQPVQGETSLHYGVQNSYYPAADSARRIPLGARDFATDTGTRATHAPSWRHAGLDLAVPSGTPVRAPANAVVADVGDYSLTGRTLTLDHGQGVFSVYFHLDTVLVRGGETVGAGMTVARSDATGLVTGPHLHYGVYVHGKDVDPTAWYDMPSFAVSDTAARVAGRR